MGCAAQCPECERGSYKTVHGVHTTECTDCAAGKYGHEDVGMTLAQRIKHKSAESHCRTCPHGQYQPAGGKKQCIACAKCPGGSYRTGCSDTSAGVCTPCAKGYFKSTRAHRGMRNVWLCTCHSRQRRGRQSVTHAKCCGHVAQGLWPGSSRRVRELRSRSIQGRRGAAADTTCSDCAPGKLLRTRARRRAMPVRLVPSKQPPAPLYATHTRLAHRYVRTGCGSDSSGTCPQCPEDTQSRPWRWLRGDVRQVRDRRVPGPEGPGHVQVVPAVQRR